jgi:hypothetical protein
MEHRNALIVDAERTEATGYTERATALEVLETLPPMTRRRTVAGDKGYDTQDVRCRYPRTRVHATHRAEHTRQRSTIDGRTTRHPGHVTSQWIRKRIEEPFGWMKTIAGARKLRYIGKQRNRAWLLMIGAVYNIIRIAAPDATPATGWTLPVRFGGDACRR